MVERWARAPGGRPTKKDKTLEDDKQYINLLNYPVAVARHVYTCSLENLHARHDEDFKCLLKSPSAR